MASRLTETSSERNDSSILEDTSMLEDDSSILNDSSLLGDTSELSNESELLESQLESNSEDAGDEEEENEEKILTSEDFYTTVNNLKAATENLDVIPYLFRLDNFLRMTTESLPERALPLLNQAFKNIEQSAGKPFIESIPSVEAFGDDLNTTRAINLTIVKIREYILDLINDIETVIKSCGFSTMEAGDTVSVSTFIQKYSDMMSETQDKVEELKGKITNDVRRSLASNKIANYFKAFYGPNSLELNVAMASGFYSLKNSVKNLKTIESTIDEWQDVIRKLKSITSALSSTVEDWVNTDSPMSAISGKLEDLASVGAEIINGKTITALEKLNVGTADNLGLPPGKTYTFNIVNGVIQGFYIPENLGLIELDHVTKIMSDDEVLESEEVKKLSEEIKTNLFGALTIEVETLKNDLDNGLPVELLSTSFGTIGREVVETSKSIKKVLDMINKKSYSTDDIEAYDSAINSVINIYSLASKTVVILALIAYVFENNLRVINTNISIANASITNAIEEM
jgi:hypothetical protein